MLKDTSYAGCHGVALGGDASVATNGFWSALTMATTLTLPMLFYIEDNGLGISVRGDMQTPGGDIAAQPRVVRQSVHPRRRRHRPAIRRRACCRTCVDHVRAGKGPALVRLTVPRLCSHSGPDNQKGYRTDAEIAADAERDPLPQTARRISCRRSCRRRTGRSWKPRSRATWTRRCRGRGRAPCPNAGTVKRFVYAEPRREGDADAIGGLSAAELAALDGTRHRPRTTATMLRFAEAVRRTLRTELERNPKLLVFGEDVGRKGGVHLVTEGLQKQFGAERVFDTQPVRGGHHRPRRRHGDRGTDAGGGDPVPEVRRSGNGAAQQLRHDAVAHQQSVRGAHRRAHAGRIRQGRGRSVAQPERRGAFCARHRVAGGDAVECRRRRGAAALGDAEPEPDDLLRAPVAAHDQRRQRAVSGRRLRAAVRQGPSGAGRAIGSRW